MAAGRIAVVNWGAQDGLGAAIEDELVQLGYETTRFIHSEPVPREIDFVFSFAPYGAFLPLARRVAESSSPPPIMIHWNTEGIPDLRVPWSLVNRVAALRSAYENGLRTFGIETVFPFSLATRKLVRYRYVGDYYRAFQNNQLHVFADSSAVYAQLHNQHGLPTVYAPWGATRSWYQSLDLHRDIDVLWMGKYGSKRRRSILMQVRDKLERHGIHMYLADNETNPFVFGEERTQYLNRSKIVINVTRTWYDDNFSRFALAAPNRALIVSEPMLPHCPAYQAGTHYVSAPIHNLADTILEYLSDDSERMRITENAYRLVTEQLTFGNSIARIMHAVEKAASARAIDRVEHSTTVSRPAVSV